MRPILWAFILVLGGVAYAELPDVLIDPAQREALEYVDAKTSNAVNFANNAQTATSTVTFSGYIDIGLQTVVVPCGAAYDCTATCPTGMKVLGGGGTSNNNSDFMSDNYPNTYYSWSVSWYGISGSHSAYAICARIK